MYLLHVHNLLFWQHGNKPMTVHCVLNADLPCQSLHCLQEGTFSHIEYQILHSPVSLERKLALSRTNLKLFQLHNLCTSSSRNPPFHLYLSINLCMLGIFSCFCCHLLTFFMPPSLKKLKGHIALDLSVCPSICASVLRLLQI